MSAVGRGSSDVPSAACQVEADDDDDDDKDVNNDDSNDDQNCGVKTDQTAELCAKRFASTNKLSL